MKITSCSRPVLLAALLGVTVAAQTSSRLTEMDKWPIHDE